MFTIKEISSAEEKAAICDNILRQLPNWFGIEESIVDYVAGVMNRPFYCAFDGVVGRETSTHQPIGFVSLLVHNPHTAEIYVMGILEQCHRQGVGRELVEACENYCKTNGMEFLTVKTLAESHPDPYYKKTRQFYEAMGFKPLEVFPLLWDENNPCLFLVKYLGR